MRLVDPNSMDVADLVDVLRDIRHRLGELETPVQVPGDENEAARKRYKREAIVRDHALYNAVMVDRELPRAYVPDEEDCQHFMHQIAPGEPCGCRLPTADENRGRIVLEEQAVIDRVMRNAEHFERWIEVGVTPADSRRQELEVGLMVTANPDFCAGCGRKLDEDD